MHDDDVDDIDDTVIRPQRRLPPRAGGDADRLDGSTLDVGLVRGDEPASVAPVDPVHDDPSDDDPSDDTVIRPRSGADTARGAGSEPDHLGALDDTVIRGRGLTPADGAVGTSSPPRDTPNGVGSAAGAAPGSTTPRAGRRDGPDHGLPAVPDPPERVASVRIAGRTFRLDHPVIVGRRPALPRIVRGPQPELVTVPSPRHQVSSSHVRIWSEGPAVVVEDLASTNGTVIRPAGAAAVRMASGTSMVVLTGTVVEIGDGCAIEVLSPYLRIRPPADTPDLTAPWPPAPTVPARPEPRERS